MPSKRATCRVGGGQKPVPFTFNLPMTTPLRLQEPLSGKIDLLGPPW
jgi:hypothetical protein